MLSMVPKLWKFGQCQCIGALGASGGVACLWNPQNIFPLWWVTSRSSISLVASCFETGERILLSNVYAPVEFQGKQLLWSHLHFVCSLAPFHPWILASDFNAIVELSEKRSGLARLEPSSLLLRDSIFDLNVFDVHPNNGHFTWSNRRIGANCVAERLDRFLVSYFWIGDLWFTSSKILDWRGFDHWPIKLSISSARMPRSPSFKF